MPTTYPQRGIGDVLGVRSTYFTSNIEYARRYGSSTWSKGLEGTIVELKKALSNSGTLQEWYINADYILGEDIDPNRVHISQRNVKLVPMPSPPPEPQSQNKTAQEGNGALTVLTAVLDYKTIIMSSTVVSDPVVLDPEINPP